MPVEAACLWTPAGGHHCGTHASTQGGSGWRAVLRLSRSLPPTATHSTRYGTSISSWRRSRTRSYSQPASTPTRHHHPSKAILHPIGSAIHCGSPLPANPAAGSCSGFHGCDVHHEPSRPSHVLGHICNVSCMSSSARASSNRQTCSILRSLRLRSPESPLHLHPKLHIFPIERARIHQSTPPPAPAPSAVVGATAGSSFLSNVFLFFFLLKQRSAKCSSEKKKRAPSLSGGAMPLTAAAIGHSTTKHQRQKTTLFQPAQLAPHWLVDNPKTPIARIYL